MGQEAKNERSIWSLYGAVALDLLLWALFIWLFVEFNILWPLILLILITAPCVFVVVVMWLLCDVLETKAAVDRRFGEDRDWFYKNYTNPNEEWYEKEAKYQSYLMDKIMKEKSTKHQKFSLSHFGECIQNILYVIAFPVILLIDCLR